MLDNKFSSNCVYSTSLSNLSSLFKKKKKNKKEGIRSSDDYEKYERSHLTFKDFVIRF